MNNLTFLPITIQSYTKLVRYGMKDIDRISVVGLGKLGAPFVAALAHRGFEVIGIDNDEAKVRALNQGKAPVDEPELQELISKNISRIIAVGDYSKITDTDVTFFLVPTPSKSTGGFSTKYVVSSAKASAEAIKNKKGYHLFVLTSTVMPGDTEKKLISILESSSGKKCGKDFGVCYNPEFIALGSVIHDLLNPDFVLVGESDSRAGELLERFYSRFCENKARTVRMNIINAEITKLSVNSFVTTKITFANMLARICSGYSGADSDVVTSAIGLDSRIGRKYLKGAVAYGGPCFPRDNKAMAEVGRRVGENALLAVTTDEENRRITSWLADKIVSLSKDKKVLILGLSYKPDTNVAEESQGVYLANELCRRGLKVMAHDPKAMNDARKRLADSVELCDDLDKALESSELIVVTTPWKDYAGIGKEYELSSGTTIFDCWRILTHLEEDSRFHYYAVGVNKNGRSCENGLE